MMGNEIKIAPEKPAAIQAPFKVKIEHPRYAKTNAYAIYAIVSKARPVPLCAYTEIFKNA
jgi:hypothetical protein